MWYGCSMKEIPLTQGKFALVDDEDYKFLMQWSWYASREGNTFYAARKERVGGKWTSIRMHRVIAERHGLYMGGDIHHDDDNGLNNQIYNMFGLTRKQHIEKAVLRNDNTSGFRGVSFYKSRGKYTAYINHEGKRIFLGYFDKFEDAVAARLAAEKKYWTHAPTV